MTSLARNGLLLAIISVIMGLSPLTLFAKDSQSVSVYLPDEAFGELFKQVQLQRVFADYKTFVDSVPTKPIGHIVADYEKNKQAADFDLKKFVLENFKLPPPVATTPVNLKATMREHIKAHWKNLSRHPTKTDVNSSLIQLPNPYVVPGGRFREMFYWDSFFTIVGLLGSNEDALAKGMIDNFAFMIDRYGYIPNGNRSYFLSRSQPPFFAATLLAYAEKHGEQSILGYLPQLEKEYDFWMDGYGQKNITANSNAEKHLIVLDNNNYFNRYYGSRGEARAEAFGKETRWAENKPQASRADYFKNLRAVCESGWDFSSRWFADGMHKSTTHAMDVIPVDLNSLLFQLESTIAALHKLKRNQSKFDHYTQRAEKRKALIHKYHFDEASGTYQDYDYKLKQKTGRLSLAMVYPLYVGAAEPAVALKVNDYLEKHFLKPGGLVTTLTETGEQWDYPNGWAPLQYLSVKGLMAYKHTALASKVMSRWLALNEKVYQSDGKMMEKYNVVDPSVSAGGGEYPTQDGFGWTNGVDVAFYDLLEEIN